MTRPAFALASAQHAHVSSPVKTSSAALLNQAYEIKTKDYARFKHVLNLLDHRRQQLSPTQRWQLRYLNAWQIAFEGDYVRSNEILHDIIDHSKNRAVSAQASALLIYTLNASQHFEAAYKRADGLISGLPKLEDHEARRTVLIQVAQMMALAGQRKLALKYARQLRNELLPGENRCKAQALIISVQADSSSLHSSDPELESAIDSCLKAGQIVYANVLRVDLANMLIKEGHPHQAVGLLHKIAPSIRKSGYQRHVVELHVLLGKAYLKLNDDTRARKSAQTALSVAHAGNFSEDVKVAYDVLYQVEKKAGLAAKALEHYEKFVALDNASMKTAKARALAYQMAHQEVLVKQLKMAKLSRQNKVLQLRQSLDRKSLENKRLLIALLMAVVALIALWAYRIKRTQLRFRKMARHDDLTGACNRQHFFDQARKILQRLHKTRTDACFLILDMDHFKQVNDTHGHVIGDTVLKHATASFQGELRKSDLFGRLGGEEFGILMPDCPRAQGIEIGKRICRVLATSPAQLDDQTSITVTASIGLACTDVSGHDLKKLLIAADTALYGAKRSGRNRVHVGNTEQAAAATGNPA